MKPSYEVTKGIADPRPYYSAVKAETLNDVLEMLEDRLHDANIDLTNAKAKVKVIEDMIRETEAMRQHLIVAD